MCFPGGEEGARHGMGVTPFNWGEEVCVVTVALLVRNV